MITRLRSLAALTVVLLAVTVVVPAPASSEDGDETTPVPVTTEAEYRAALISLSSDTTGPHTIVLGANIPMTGGSDPLYGGDQPLTIDGQGQFELDGGGTGRVLASVGVRPMLTVTGATIRNGLSGTSGGAISWAGPVTVAASAFVDNHVVGTFDGTGIFTGGALATRGATTITDSQFKDNSVVATGANAVGGAIHTSLGGSSVTVVRSVMEGNSVETDTGSASAGAIASIDALISEDSVFRTNSVEGPGGAGGAATFNQLSTISGTAFDANTATATGSGSAGGGSLYSNGGAITVTDSSITNNQVSSNVALARGAALYSGTGITLDNATITGNLIGSTSGATEAPVRSGGAVEIIHTTIHDNEQGGGVSGIQADSLTAEASVVNGGTATSCLISGSETSNGYNWEQASSCGFGSGPGDVFDGNDPLLGLARNNGDLVAATEAGGDSTPRLSAYPLNGSPLIDAIPPAACSTDPDLALDQRGINRPFGAGCDIGAIEAVFPAHTQTDVSNFYEPTVRWVTSPVNTPQILSGFNDGTFGQALNITRGQAARLYYNGAGAPDVTGLPAHGFSDSTPFFENAIRWAKASGLFNGYPNGTFRPNNPIIRGDYIRSLYNFAGTQDVTGLADHPFTDVTPFYEDAVKWAKAQGLANGFPNNTFRQTNNINRGNAARTFYNTAQTPNAWADPTTAPPNMLFRPNTP